MRPLIGLNATFATTIARPGNVGFVSQSGALCTAVLDWSRRENVGFSAFASLGSDAVELAWQQGWMPREVMSAFRKSISPEAVRAGAVRLGPREACARWWTS